MPESIPQEEQQHDAEGALLDRLLDQLLIMMTALLTFGYFFILSRTQSLGQGWRDLVQTSVLVLMVIACFARHKISIPLKQNLLIFFTLALGIAGFTTLGFYAGIKFPFR